MGSHQPADAPTTERLIRRFGQIWVHCTTMQQGTASAADQLLSCANTNAPAGAAISPRAGGETTTGCKRGLETRFTVREADPTEYDHIVVVVNSAFSHWASHRDAQDGEWQRVSVEKLHDELVRGQKLGLDSELLVCVDVESGTIYGTVLANQWYAAEDFASAGRPDTESFGQLAVVPEAQGHGIGQLLVRACEQRARDRGKRRMDICFVSLDAAYLLPFYTALGYERGENAYPNNTSGLRPVSLPASSAESTP